MKKILIVLILATLSQTLPAQQEAQYTQGQFNNNLVLNPAYAGYADCGRLGFRYRNQWTGFQGSPTSFNVTYDSDIRERLGIGGVFVYDQLGIENRINAELSLNYQIPMSSAKQSVLAVGMKGGYHNVRANFANLSNVNTSDPLYDPSLFNNLSMGYLGFGMLYYTDRFFFGASSPRLVGLESTSIRQKLIEAHFYFNTGYTFDVGNDITLTPSILLKYQKAAPLEADLALNLWMRNIGVGTSYRTGDAINMMLQYQFPKLIVGYAHDFTSSAMRSQTMGSHEFFIGYSFCKKRAPVRQDGTVNPLSNGRTNL